MIWKGGLWIGIFVHRDYCRYTTDRSPFTNRPERISSLMKLRSVVWSDQGASIGRDIEDLVVVRGNDDSGGMFVHRDFCRTTTGRSPFVSRSEQISSLMKLWSVGWSDQGASTGREIEDLVVVRGNDDSDLDERKIKDLITPGGSDVTESTTEVFSFTYVARSAWNYLNDWVVERGHDVSGQNTWKTRDLITPGSPDVAVSATEIFSYAYAVCCAWDGPAYNYKIGAMNTGQKYDAGYVVADDLTGAFSSDLKKGATELSDSVFVPFLAFMPKTRSNTTSDRDLNRIVFHDVILSSTCPACPRILTTSPNKRQIRSVQQSFGRIVDIEDNNEENDNMLEEIYEIIYVKMINGKTISTRHHRNMTAAVILDEVERRSLIPRDMIRLVHKGKMISEKKTMKENNIEAKATIEMSLRLLGGWK